MTTHNEVLTSAFSNLITAAENNHNPARTSFFTQQSVTETPVIQFLQ